MIISFFRYLILKKIENVLDIGAGKGGLVTYCAEFGAKVDALDIKPFPEELKKYPNINFINTPIEKWKSPIFKKYDLIIARSVLHFLNPEFVFKKLLPKLVKSLASEGFLYIATMTPPANSGRFTYRSEELSDALKPLNLCFKKEERQAHELAGEVQEHYFWQLVYQKNKNNNCSISFK